MASLIPGYEYDIFISYRQKDNKYDGWVTEFVDNLKKELEIDKQPPGNQLRELLYNSGISCFGINMSRC
jgi:hypothetical protein